MAESSLARPGSIALLTLGAVTTGFVAYAFYFDYRRQTDAEFRKKLRKESKKTAKLAKEAEQASEKEQKQAILEALERVQAEGVPEDREEWEAFFMNEVASGEKMCQDGSDPIEAASAFYRALKVYPQPRELITIYDKTVPKPVLDILAVMIAYDPTITNKATSATSSEDGITVE